MVSLYFLPIWFIVTMAKLSSLPENKATDNSIIYSSSSQLETLESSSENYQILRIRVPELEFNSMEKSERLFLSRIEFELMKVLSKKLHVKLLVHDWNGTFLRRDQLDFK